jgi:hypothetical protein
MTAARKTHAFASTGKTRARVARLVDDDHVAVRSPLADVEDVVNAEIAIALYAPAIGDDVLVELVEGAAYVVGVLGDARRRARAHVELTATETLVLRAPEIRLETHTLETDATSIVERALRVHRHTEDAVEEVAGRMRTTVDGTFDLQAQRVALGAVDDAIVDGARVLLG